MYSGWVRFSYLQKKAEAGTRRGTAADLALLLITDVEDGGDSTQLKFTARSLNKS